MSGTSDDVKNIFFFINDWLNFIVGLNKQVNCSNDITKVLNLQRNNLESFSHPNEMLIREVVL